MSSSVCGPALHAPEHGRGDTAGTAGPDQLADPRGIGDRLAVDGEHPIARPQTALGRRPARRAPRRARGRCRHCRCRCGASARHRSRWQSSVSRSSVTRRCARPSRSVTIKPSFSPRRTACVTSQRRSTSERRSCHSTPSVEYARAQSPARRPARSARLDGGRRAEHRLRLVDADPVRRRVEDDREQQVRCRAGGDDGGALQQRLPVEGAVPIGRSDRRPRARRACARSRRAAARRRRIRCCPEWPADATAHGRSRPRSAAP